MIKEMIDKTNDLGKSVGAPKIPTPSKNTLRIGDTVNKVAGVTLLAAGIVTRSKWALILGASSLVVNTLVYAKEKQDAKQSK